jgi:hypothetical protein
MEDGAHPTSLVCMKKRLLIGLLLTGLLLIALLSWTVQGVRWAVTGGPRRALQPA